MQINVNTNGKEIFGENNRSVRMDRVWKAETATSTHETTRKQRNLAQSASFLAVKRQRRSNACAHLSSL